MECFTKTCYLPVSVEDAFAWHTRPGSLERQIPPWMNSTILERQGTIHNGDTFKIKYDLPFWHVIMHMKHQNYAENVQFESVQTKGFFRKFEHRRSFYAIDAHTSKITDTISFENTIKFLTFFLNATFLEKKIENFFTYGHRTLIKDLILHSKYSKKKLKILITGSSGFVGRELVPFLLSGGHTVLCLKHDTYAEQLENAENFDAMIHLAGENIAGKKWTPKRKNELIESRVKFTHDIIQNLKKLKYPPKIFISASGIGILGHCPVNEICNENSKVGEGFLPTLAAKWEEATNEAKELNMRVVNLRFGAILSSSGGLLKKILLPYKWFLGGKFGSGKQHMPWVSIVDVLGIILFALSNSEVDGPLNVVAPQIVSNEEFSEQLASVLSKPNSFRIPQIIIEALFGEMGRELFLSDIAVEPEKIQKLGYEFLHSNLNDVLFHYLDM